MILIRKSQDRGHADHGWLKSQHTFSFADYYDPRFMGFSALRVINEDHIDGGQGFGMHGHRDMEIISYVAEGALEHKDSMGNDTIIRPGEVQRMSAGTGVRHSEFNHMKDRSTHLLQIWIQPDTLGLKPSYGQKSFAQDFAENGLVLVASKDGRDGSVSLSQDVSMYAAKNPKAGEKNLRTKLTRHVWLQVIKGKLRVDATHELLAGDGAGITGVDNITLNWSDGAEFLVFDLP